MQYQEKLVSLNREDLRLIAQQKRNAKIALAVVFVIFAAIFYFILSDAPLIAQIMFGIFMTFFISVFVFIVTSSFKKLSKDAKEGNKRYIECTIINKYQETTKSGKSSRTNYFFDIGERKLNVEYKYYKRFNNGNDITIYMLPHSERILSIEGETEAESPQQQIPQTAHKLSKKEMPLSRIDNTRLMELKSARLKKAIIWSLVFSIPLFFIAKAILFFFLVYVFPIQISEGIFTNTALLAVSLWIVMRLSKVNKKYKSDINGDLKYVVQLTVEDKFNSNTPVLKNGTIISSTKGNFCYIKIRGEQLRLTEEDYNNTNSGDVIDVHISPATLHILQLQKEGKSFDVVHIKKTFKL